MDALDRATEHAGSVAQLAEKLGVVPMTVYQWRKRGIPAERAVQIEEVTGGAVTRVELRPDLFAGAPTSNPPAAIRDP